MFFKKNRDLSPKTGPSQDKSAGSIQARIDAARNGKGKEESPRKSGKKSAPGQAAGAEKKHEEAFLDQFASEMRKRRPAPMPHEVRPEPVQQNQAAPQESPEQAPADKALPPEGAIIYFGNNLLGIYHRDVPDRNMQAILMLNPDGTLSPEGINLLNGTHFRQIGTIPEDQLPFLLHNLVWERDHVVFHLDNFRSAELVPRVEDRAHGAHGANDKTRRSDWPNPQKETRASIEADARNTDDQLAEGMPRGQHFVIDYGKGRRWDAIYWCKDEHGTVVAHKTRNTWSLMHLDLSRFKNQIEIHEVLSEEEMTEIERSIRHNH